ncbi:peptidoglycan-binding protein [Paracoccus denitrificans]|uniref:Peptidoglycan-binding domain 1 protein n=1 Tax=Paracoccus denitrificans (strain Pd 1222) TaxID=318586 RepID=A1B829_PARDP|nr:peptidoglycan-binding protein [Paracoccus denitrificans]ABL71673.1 Peptidoglycan-binding domain 1 protein [Paracoccus denitrificans PD1222]MBB4629382.1 putative chitinase [Paracoccus denitrificans]
MILTADHLSAIAGTATNDNMRSTVAGLAKAGVGAGLERPHRLAHYLGQLVHESAGWRYDREIWGPTAAQKRYEGRADLGNTQPGDGSRFRGRGPIQITGRANYRSFAAWAQKLDRRAPDFESDPEAVNTDPWEGLGPIWYWSTGNPTRASLNGLADANDLTMITRRINGGTNGMADRQARYVRAALVLAGYGATEVRRFQKEAGLTADGIAGPKTLAALHAKLKAMPVVQFSATTPNATKPAAPSAGIIAALLALFKSPFGGKA